jgi:hypothetical protein
MANAIPPVVRYMIPCDEAIVDPQQPGKITIVGLTTVVKWPAEATTAFRLEKLVVLLILAGGRGVGSGRIVCVNEETGQPLFGSADRPVSFEGTNPSLPYGVTFKLLDCRFPGPGEYSIQFELDGEVLSRQTLIVR